LSLVHAILGFLQREPMTGYDLKTLHLDDSVNYFWPADQAQIYRTLDKLTEQGYVENRIEIQSDRPNRKVYSITEAGRAELARWLVAIQPLPIHREPFLVQLYFAGQLPNAKIIELMEGQLKLHQDQIAIYRNLPVPPFDDPDATRDTILQRVTLEAGIRYEQMAIDLINDALHLARNLKDDPDIGSG
jgi:PadR family transcriptional regulator AphA